MRFRPLNRRVGRLLRVEGTVPTQTGQRFFAGEFFARFDEGTVTLRQLRRFRRLHRVVVKYFSRFRILVRADRKILQSASPPFRRLGYRRPFRVRRLLVSAFTFRNRRYGIVGAQARVVRRHVIGVHVRRFITA